MKMLKSTAFYTNQSINQSINQNLFSK